MLQVTKQKIFEFWCEEAVTVKTVADFFNVTEKEVENVINELEEY